MKKSTLTLLILIFLAILGAAAWYFYTSKIAPNISTPGTEPFGGFSPLGGGGNIKVPQQPQSSNSTTPIASSTPNTKLPTLRQLTTTPIAGAIASTTASSTIIRYVDRGVGHVYDISLTKNSAAQKVTNTTIPRVYSAVWNKQANAIVLRYMKEGSSLITNFYADIVQPRNTTPVLTRTASSSLSVNTATSTTLIGDIVADLRGKFFPGNILSVIASPKGDRIFILSEQQDGSVGYVSQFNGDKQVKVFESPLKQLTVDWNAEDSIIITTKATYVGVGIAYLVDLKKGATEKLIGPLRNLSTLMSTDSKHLLYSASPDGSKILLYILTNKDKSVQDVVFRTLPEKCVWSKKNASVLFCAVPSDMRLEKLPDSWYQGSVSFVDNIWELDTDTGEVRQLSNLLDQSGQTIDATNLFLDPKENYLMFTNNKDLTLWSLDIRE